MKKILKLLDQKILKNKLSLNYSNLLRKTSMSYKNNFFESQIMIQYQANEKSTINQLCGKYGSDKGDDGGKKKPYNWQSHNYADLYDILFGLRKKDVELVVECGIGTNDPGLISSMGTDGQPGASLRVWRDYFSQAIIIGCDIDKNILFDEDRIKTFQCDQTSKQSIRKFRALSKIEKNSVDIIIDDGLHEYKAGIIFFEHMIDSLKENGIYIIEDVTHEDMKKYKNFFLNLSNHYEAKFIYLKGSKNMIGRDNNLICITRNS